MKQLTPSNIIFVVLLVLLIVPTTRSFIQVNLQKVLTKVIPVSTIDAEDQITLSDYNISLKGINTSNINLTDYKENVIFINFWATWCPPCIAEMPDLQTLHDKYKNDIVFAFITNDSQPKIESFLKNNKLTLPIYQHVSKTPKEIDYNSLPTTFIIDKKGKIILHKTGVANWNSNSFYEKLDQLIKK